MLVQRDTTLQQQAKETFQEQMHLFNSFDSYRKQWDDRAIDWYKMLVGYKEEDDDENRSNLHIPRTYQIIDTIRARLVMSFFKNHPYVEFTPAPSQMTRFSMEQSEEKADVASALVNEQLRKNDITSKFYDYVTSLLVFPLGILGVGWRYEKDYIKKKVPVPEIIQTRTGPRYTGNYVYQVQEGQEVIWDDNEITNIDFFDFWPDPRGTNLDDCRGVFQREFVTYEELLYKLNFLDHLDEGIIYLESEKELEKIQGASNLEQGRDQRMAEIGLSDQMDVFAYNQDQEINRNTEFELLHYWEDNRHAITVNRQKTIYDGPSPYWRHRKKPFVVGTYDKLPNEFYGMSAVQIVSDLQEEENTIHNQRTDNVNFILNKMWKARRGADIDESELVSRPHGVVWLDNLDDVDTFDMPDVAASSFQTQNIISQVMENTLATPPVIRGATSKGDQTATETTKQSNNASMRFDVKLNLFRTMSVQRLAYLMDMNNQQFIDSKRIIRMGQEDSIKWRSINPGELIGEFDYRPAGANVDPAANKQVRREQLSQMMTFLMQAQVPFVDYHQLIKEWLESFDIENARKFLVPKEQWQQQQALLNQMNQDVGGESKNRPTQSEQNQNSQTGKSVGRRPQTQRTTQQRPTGQVR